MNWQELQNIAVSIVHSLTDSELSGEAKREAAADMLTPLISRAAETADDLVLLVPGGFGVILKGIVDSPMFDNEQRKLERWVVEQLIEHAYQALRYFKPREGDRVTQSQLSVLNSL